MPAYYSVAVSVCQPGENMDVETGSARAGNTELEITQM